MARRRILERKPKPSPHEALFGRVDQRDPATRAADACHDLSEERLAGYALLLDIGAQQRVAKLQQQLRVEVEAELAEARRREVEAALRRREGLA